MATVAEIRAKIEAAERDLQQNALECEQAEEELVNAIERQRLRRQLDHLHARLARGRETAEKNRIKRRRIDYDLTGPHAYGIDDGSDTGDSDSGDGLPSPRPPLAGSHKKHKIGSEHVTCSSVVTTGNYTWRIGGMSWLVETLKQMSSDRLDCSSYFHLGSTRFDFSFHPSGGKQGTLAILHCDDCGVTFRYKISIKRRGGEFVQWGETGKVCQPNNEDDRKAFGPDVPGDGGADPQGIFGLNYEALLKSEWVEDDTLTVKFELELRERAGASEVETKIEVPPASIIGDLSLLFEAGKHSDVTFLVKGQPIKAHSAILCARSEVFDKLLHGWMRESETKEIQIHDCDAALFKELLRFVYTDDFSYIETLLENVGHNEKHTHRIHTLQGLLAASHKYALTRLQVWCELKLSANLTVEEVCSTLCQAHLYESKQLADACLAFMQQHYERVATTRVFGSLAKEWPEVMLKINLFMGSVREECAKAALEAVRHG